LWLTELELEAGRDFPRRQRAFPRLQTVIDKKSSRQNFADLFATPELPKKRDYYTHTMAQRAAVKTTYEVNRTLQPIYSGGSLSLSEDGRILAASLGEDVLLTDLTNGKELGRVEGDGETITAMACKCCTRVSDEIISKLTW
jgi:hypothetical protein